MKNVYFQINGFPILATGSQNHYRFLTRHWLLYSFTNRVLTSKNLLPFFVVRCPEVQALIKMELLNRIKKYFSDQFFSMRCTGKVGISFRQSERVGLYIVPKMILTEKNVIFRRQKKRITFFYFLKSIPNCLECAEIKSYVLIIPHYFTVL